MADKIWLPSHLRQRNATLGSETLIYFQRISDGHLIIPPVCWAKTPDGYVRMEANSAKKLETVSKQFEAQKQREFAVVDERRCRIIEAKHKELRDRLNHAMANAPTQRVKDFIRLALNRLEEGEQKLRPRKIEGHLLIEEG